MASSCSRVPELRTFFIPVSREENREKGGV
jgi:hypothetical protein